jgi:serine/threonine protein phosphatase 1
LGGLGLPDGDCANESLLTFVSSRLQHHRACFTALQCALNAIGFNRAIGRLFLMGDMVDRGSESHQVTTWLDYTWLHFIFGNHELTTCRSAFGSPYPDMDQLAHGGQWLQELTAADRHRIARRMPALPLAIEVETAKGG